MKKWFTILFLIFSNSIFAFSFRFKLLNPFANFQNKVVFGSSNWTSTIYTIPNNVTAIKLVVYGGGGSGASCWWGGNTGCQQK